MNIFSIRSKWRGSWKRKLAELGISLFIATPCGLVSYFFYGIARGIFPWSIKTTDPFMHYMGISVGTLIIGTTGLLGISALVVWFIPVIAGLKKELTLYFQ